MEKVLKILCIGNSFSDDMTAYAWEVAGALGFERVILGNLYIGGCSLSTHLHNARMGEAAYEFRVNTAGEWNTSQRSLRFGIEYEEWQYITLQQASGYSGIGETYKANLTDLIEYVKRTALCPQVKLFWHQTWAYQGDSTHPYFVYYGNNQRTMYEAIEACVKNEVLPTGEFVGVIPCGKAIQRARETRLGDTLTRDGFHLSIPMGRYIAALTFIGTVTGRSVAELAYAPEGIGAAEKVLAIECAELARTQKI